MRRTQQVYRVAPVKEYIIKRPNNDIFTGNRNMTVDQLVDEHDKFDALDHHESSQYQSQYS